MTNTSSGSKRPHDGSADTEQRKRPRDSDPKDWRDSRASGKPHGARDRHASDDRYRPDHSPRRDRDHDRRERDDRRDSSKRDSSRYRDRRHESRGKHSTHADGRRNPSPDSPLVHTMVHHALQGLPIPIEKKAKSKPPPSAPAPEPIPSAQSELEARVGNLTFAARRAKRQAILAKYAGVASVNTTEASPSPGPSSAVQPPPPSAVVSDPQSQHHSIVVENGAVSASRDMSVGPSHQQRSQSASPAPGVFELAKGGEEEGALAEAQEQATRDGAREQVSAADYDPSLDRREDEQRRVRGAQEELNQDVEMIEVEEEEEEDEDDDVDDMFAVSVVDKKKVKKVKKVVKRSLPALITTTLDNAADSEGYYQIILGEHLDGGRHVANVARARVLQSETGEVGKEVAIKIIRCQESMYKAGQKESDPDDKKHVVRLERTFEHRGHLSLPVRAYAQQLFLATEPLRKYIKPDNILVNEQKTQLKLCDLVSRFYRAPEIILGIPYDPRFRHLVRRVHSLRAVHGKILSPGRSNNQMLLLMMELKGRFNQKTIKKAKFGDTYFDEMGGFDSIEKDRVTGADVVRKVHISKPARDLRARLMPPSSDSDERRRAQASYFICGLLDNVLPSTPRGASLKGGTHASVPSCG
ncbi:hypothetical protein EDB84DRAFT_1588054 [Lactarius hengduanensis]|nr:hypothetical protein EDB84DRAFT_1588054 [Lactarius hengduanensis]